MAATSSYLLRLTRLIELAGIEPTVSWPPARRVAKLRYSSKRYPYGDSNPDRRLERPLALPISVYGRTKLNLRKSRKPQKKVPIPFGYIPAEGGWLESNQQIVL